MRRTVLVLSSHSRVIACINWKHSTCMNLGNSFPSFVPESLFFPFHFCFFISLFESPTFSEVHLFLLACLFMSFFLVLLPTIISFASKIIEVLHMLVFGKLAVFDSTTYRVFSFWKIWYFFKRCVWNFLSSIYSFELKG